MYIVIEGMPGTGKTSTAKALVEKLNAHYMKTAFPATELGILMQKIHDDGELQESELLYLASAFSDELLVRKILDEGKSIVKDKSLFTSIAHLEANGYANDNKCVIDCIDALYSQLIELSAEPDLVVFLATDLEIVNEYAKGKTDMSEWDSIIMNNPEIYSRQEKAIIRLLENKYQGKILYLKAFSGDCDAMAEKIIKALRDKKE